MGPIAGQSLMQMEGISMLLISDIHECCCPSNGTNLFETTKSEG